MSPAEIDTLSEEVAEMLDNDEYLTRKIISKYVNLKEKNTNVILDIIDAPVKDRNSLLSAVRNYNRGR